MTPWSDYVDNFGLSMKQARLLAVLSDEKSHPRDECLARALGITHASAGIIATHMSRIRKKLEPHGYRISGDGGGYRLIPPPPVPLSKRRERV